MPRHGAPEEPGPLWQETAGQDVIEDGAVVDPNAPTGVQSANERAERWGDEEVVGMVVGGFNRSYAICSTPFFALAAEMFPGEMRGACVDLFV